jgi:hypothetical protein
MCVAAVGVAAKDLLSLGADEAGAEMTDSGITSDGPVVGAITDSAGFRPDSVSRFSRCKSVRMSAAC